MKDFYNKCTLPSTRSNSNIDCKNVNGRQKSTNNFLSTVRLRMHHNLKQKYSTCSSYLTLNQITRTVTEKQCVLKTTIKDIRKDQQEQYLQDFYSIQKSATQIPQLIEYYRYYSQKSVIFIEDFFKLLYEYQERKKFVEYKRLKVLLNLSDSKQENQSIVKKQNHDLAQNNFNPNALPTTRVFETKNKQAKQKNIKNNQNFTKFNILDDIDLSVISNRAETQESVLINKLRNKLSKHVNSPMTKNLSIEELDRFYHFQKKDKNFNPVKLNFDKYLLTDRKSKKSIKQKKLFRQINNCPQDLRKEPEIKKRTAKRNNSCEFTQKYSKSKNYTQLSGIKLRHKKNMSMDFRENYNTTPQFNYEQKAKMLKIRKSIVKTHQRQQVPKTKAMGQTIKGCQVLVDSISDLKNKIKKEKEKLMRQTYKQTNSRIKTQKRRSNIPIHYERFNSSIVNLLAEQKGIKKSCQRLREKTVFIH